jgi:hypothetical protein
MTMRTHASDILQIAKSANRDAIEYAGQDHTPQDSAGMLWREHCALRHYRLAGMLYNLAGMLCK